GIRDRNVTGVQTCALPISTDPAINASNVKTIADLPPPKLYNVPEAQPLPICIPIPKIKEPTITLMPTGATDAVGISPVKLNPVQIGRASRRERNKKIENIE